MNDPTKSNDFDGPRLTWTQYTRLTNRIGFLEGAMQGLRFRVDDHTQKAIDDVLAKAKEKYPYDEVQST